jgi:hypothetical protein
MDHTYAVSVRLPSGDYATVTIVAGHDTAARNAAIAMTGGTVSCIRRLS